MAQQYDVTAKLLLGRPRSPLFDVMFGAPTVARWRNIELPSVENPRSDLVAETPDGTIHYVEIDTSNDPRILPRVVRKYWRAREAFPDRTVRPVLLYLGRKAVTLPCPLEDGYSPFYYHLIDMRDQSGKELLASADIEDNMLAVLTQADKEQVFAVVLAKLAKLGELDRDDHATRFVILCGLRNLEHEIIEKVRSMITLDDLLANKVFGPALVPLLQEHLDKGHMAGERDSLRLQVRKRFGDVPDWAGERLQRASESELHDLLERILTAAVTDHAICPRSSHIVFRGDSHVVRGE